MRSNREPIFVILIIFGSYLFPLINHLMIKSSHFSLFYTIFIHSIQFEFILDLVKLSNNFSARYFVHNYDVVLKRQRKWNSLVNDSTVKSSHKCSLQELSFTKIPR